MDLTALRYATSHEWAKFDGDVVTVGITSFAAEQLGDLTALQLPKVGAAVVAGKAFGEIESVKSVSDLYAPVSGVVAEVNPALLPNPVTKAEPDLTKLMTDPYSYWMIRIKLAEGAQTDHLLTKELYDAQIASEGH
jgi:glycine cleavage system H protein